jgi:hypothetical protein
MLDLRRAALLAASAASLALCSGCSSSSTACVADGTVTVQVTDQNIDSPNNFVCNETVTLQNASGGAAVTLAAEGPAASCGYTGTVPAGTYTLTATGSAYTTATQNEVISSVGCVTDSPTLTVEVFEAAQP